MKELTYAVVFLAGAVITVQAVINTRLGQVLGNGMHAVLVSFVIGTVGTVAICLIEGGSAAAGEALKSGPWWMWTGGLLGVAFVWSTIFAVPKIGVSVMFPLVVTGQMVAAIVVEYFGLFGSPVQPVSWARVVGVLLVVSGVVVLGMTRNPGPAD